MGTSRVQHTTHVSGPVLHYTNAHQRNDLQSIGTSTGHGRSAPQNVSLWDFPQPRTGGGCANKKPPNLRIKIPPSDVVSMSQDTGEGNTIGIALGSPRLVDRRNPAPPHWAQQDPFARREKSRPTAPKPIAPVQRKPSKWRKIGGLFKAKNAVKPSTSRSYYQVRNNRSPQGWSHSIDYQSPKATGLSPGVEDKGNCFGGIGTCLEAKRKLSKTDPKSRRRKAKQQGAPESEQNENAPFLEVELPDIHMERYSVMFGGLFGQGRPSVLARRSRTLDEMIPSNTKASTTEPQQEQRPRRATSPTRPRTPSFSLFPPTQVGKAPKTLGTPNIARGPSALSQNRTLPTEHEREEAEYLLNANSSMTYTPMTPRSQFSELSMAHGHRQKAEYINPDSPALSPLLSPLGKLVSPSKRMSMVSPKTTPRNPFTEKPESEDGGQGQDGKGTNGEDVPKCSPNLILSESAEPSPPVEISIARSVSVSKGEKKQVLIPGASKNGRLTPTPVNANETEHGKTQSQKEKERILGTKGKTPQVMDAYHGHRPGNSHDVRIETGSMC